VELLSLVASMLSSILTVQRGGKREAEVRFEVTVQTWRRLSSSGEATSEQDAHRRVRVTRPTKRHLVEQRIAMRYSDRRKRDQAGEARATRSLAGNRIPTPETMMDGELSEGHDDGLMCIALVMEALVSFVAPPESG
jgi:hypothetical protein